MSAVVFSKVTNLKERGAKAASPSVVSSIHDQEPKRGDLDGANKYGWYHEVTPQVLHSRSTTPIWWALRRQSISKCNFPWHG